MFKKLSGGNNSNSLLLSKDVSNSKSRGMIWFCVILLLAQKQYVFFVFLAKFDENFVSFVTISKLYKNCAKNSFILFQDL